MAFSSPFILRLLASSVSAATRAGKIIRDIMASGELGIVEKVCTLQIDGLRLLKAKLFAGQKRFAN